MSAKYECGRCGATLTGDKTTVVRSGGVPECPHSWLRPEYKARGVWSKLKGGR